MSLLWPDRLIGGLFPGHCWVARNGKEYSRTPLLGGDAPAAMLAALDGLLDEHGSAVRKRSRVSLVVSDSLAALTPLPWHDQLRTDDEIDAYAKVCFQKRGEDIDDNWVMHAAFRRHGAAGLAYALPRSWVEALAARLAARGLLLDRVLPLTAQAYWNMARRGPAGQELLLLRESHRTGVLIYGPVGLEAIDAEAGAGDAQTSARRLLGRVAAYHPNIKIVQVWSESAAAANTESPQVAEILAGAGVMPVPRDEWS